MVHGQSTAQPGGIVAADTAHRYQPVTAEPEAIPKGRSGLVAGWEASGRKGINPNPRC